MFYQRIDPHSSLTSIIDCYWIIEDFENSTPTQQKIIPDGYIEIIYHYGDPYKINFADQWELQSDKLIAGQIDRHFYIENTGETAMIGIKFKPAALSHLFGLDMQHLTNKVSALTDIDEFQSFSSLLAKAPYEEIVKRFDQFFIKLIQQYPIKPHVIDEAVNIIFQCNGLISIQEMSEKLNVSQRQLERYFKKYVGLSPKLYTRIIRFNYIFELMKKEIHNWQDLVFKSGYYDQSHFIKNFQEFAGEDPTKYGFDQKNIANFFLQKLEK